MKKVKGKWIFCFLFILGLSGLQAQTALHVNEKTGKITSFELSSLNKLIFNSGVMTVNKKDGNSADFSLLNIRYLNFGTITSIKDVQGTGSSMILYPNPVKDRLQIRYESSCEQNVLVQLIDIQGKVVFQQTMKSQTGINSINIPMDPFQNGIYLCRLQNGKNIEMAKFIKY